MAKVKKINEDLAKGIDLFHEQVSNALRKRGIKKVPKNFSQSLLARKLWTLGNGMSIDPINVRIKKKGRMLVRFR